ncbi:hypothetical protein ACH4E5_21375 [Streptomyces afghaniensis]|uniref:hypothetical protein n=1 Tax=Streptomyces afghaniensis TaxID=66865 RepID=UPI0037B49B79
MTLKGGSPGKIPLAKVEYDRRVRPTTFTLEKTRNGEFVSKIRLTSGLTSAVLAGAVMLSGAGAASASTHAGTGDVTIKVSPIEEQRSKCTVYHDKNSCKSLMRNTKMEKVVKNCLIKAAIGGAGALVVGKFVSKDLAEDIAAKVVVAGATGCLASLG